MYGPPTLVAPGRVYHVLDDVTEQAVAFPQRLMIGEDDSPEGQGLHDESVLPCRPMGGALSKRLGTPISWSTH